MNMVCAITAQSVVASAEVPVVITGMQIDGADVFPVLLLVALGVVAVALAVVLYILFAVRRENEQLRLAAANISDMVICTDGKNKITYMNSTAENLTGWTFKEVEKRKLSEIVQIEKEDEDTSFTSRIDNLLVMNSCSPQTLSTMKGRNNRSCKLSLKDIPVETEGKGGSRIIVAKDVTGDSLKHELFIEFQNRFQAMFSNAPLLIAITTCSGKIIFANKLVVKSLGKDSGALTGSDLKSLLHNDDASILADALHKILHDSNATVNLDLRFISASGQMIYTESTCFPMVWKNNRPKYIMLLGKDVTDSIEIKQAVAHEREQQRLIFENVPEQIFQFDNDLKLVWGNHSRNMEDDRKCSDIICHNMGTCMDCPVTECIRHGHRCRRELKLEDDTCLLITASPLWNDDKDIGGGIVIIIDVTEQKRQEAQLLHLQKMDALGKLAGGVAHDFNNILQVNFGYNDLIRQHLDHDGMNMWDTVMQASLAAKKLVRQLLTFSRTDRKMETEECDLNDILRHFHKMLRRIIGENITFELNLCGEELFINGDAGLLEQVFMNLCVNARDAMPGGGNLELTTSLLTDREHFPMVEWAENISKLVCCEVKDTGIGIPSDIVDKIFDPFFTTKPVNKGNGLGLSMVYSIIDKHGGKIMVESEKESGTTFKIFLPNFESKPIIPKDKKKEESSDRYMIGRDFMILHIEDDDNVRIITRKMLEPEGFTVVSAEDGDIGLRMFNEYCDRINLVLLDAVLPRMSGNEIAEEIRKRRSDLPILFCSGYSNELIDLGENDILINKPFRKQDLLNKIGEIIDIKQYECQS